MGLCHEFGSQIRAGCDHPMRAGASACSCAECGVVCRGLFDGCPDVWERGPRPVAIAATRAAAANGTPSAIAFVGGPLPETARTVRSGSPAAIGPAPESHDSARGAKARRDDPPGADSDRSADPDPAREAAGDPRREVLRWFEEAFSGVRGELQALIGSMTHQQAMLAELLDSRQAELRLALVAESLPDIVSDAVRAAMDEHTTAMSQSFDRVHERFRQDVDQIRVDTASTVESLNQSFLKLSGAIAVHDEEAEQREGVRLGTLKGSVTRQITPLVDALTKLGARIDALAQKDETARPLSPAATTSPLVKAPIARASTTRPPVSVSAAATPKRRAAMRPVAKAGPTGAGRLVSTARMARPEEVVDVPPAPRPAVMARTAVPAPRSTGGAAIVGRRVSTARVTASRAADIDADIDDDGPEEAVVPRVPRVITRRKAPLPAPAVRDEPAYELEDPDDETEGADTDDLDWAPPAWVSTPAGRPASAGGAPSRPDAKGRILRSSRTPD